MGANVSPDITGPVLRRGRARANGPVRIEGGQRRFDIVVSVASDGLRAGPAWERSVWRGGTVLVAECPPPRLGTALRQALATVATTVAHTQGWHGGGTVSFALDNRSGAFQVIGTRPAGVDEGMCGWNAQHGHLITMRLACDAAAAGQRAGASILVEGRTRGDALRRAHRALCALSPGGQAEAAWLLRTLESVAFCSGMTGSQLNLQ